MRYKPYFSRFLNERKRKIKAAYLTKVITGVVLSLAISSSSLAALANDMQNPPDILEIHGTLEDVGGLNDSGPGVPDDFFAEGEDEIGADDEILLGNAEFEDGGESGAPGDCEEVFAQYGQAELNCQELFASFAEAVEIYRNLKSAYIGGAEYAEVTEAYDAAETLYYELIESRLEQANEATKAALKEYKDGRAGYNNAMKQYHADKAGHLNAVESYEAAMAEYKAGLQAYAQNLSDYAKGLVAYKLELAEYELAQQRYGKALAAYIKGHCMDEPEAPAAPALQAPVKPEAPETVKPAQTEEASAKPMLNKPEKPSALDHPDLCGIALEMFDIDS